MLKITVSGRGVMLHKAIQIVMYQKLSKTLKIGIKIQKDIMKIVEIIVARIGTTISVSFSLESTDFQGIS